MNKLERELNFIILQKKIYNQNPLFKPEVIKSITKCLYDLTKTNEFFTGMISETALMLNTSLSGNKLKLIKKGLVKEHWYGVGKFVNELLEMDSITLYDLAKSIRYKLTWNYVTDYENQILKNNNQDYTSISNLCKLNSENMVKIIEFEDVEYIKDYSYYQNKLGNLIYSN